MKLAEEVSKLTEEFIAGLSRKEILQKSIDNYEMCIRDRAYRPLHVRAPIGLPHKSPLRKAAPDGKGRCFNAACTDFRLIKKDAAAIAGNRAGKTCLYHSERPFVAPSVHSAGL